MIPFKPDRTDGNTPCLTMGVIPTCLNDFTWFDDRATDFDNWLVEKGYRRATIEDIRLLCDKLYRNGKDAVSYKPIDGSYDEFKSFQYSVSMQGKSGRIFVSHDVGSGFVWDDITFETAHFAEIENFDIRTGNPIYPITDFETNSELAMKFESLSPKLDTVSKIKSLSDCPLSNKELAVKVDTLGMEVDTASKIKAIIKQDVPKIPIIDDGDVIAERIQTLGRSKENLYEFFDLVNHPANANGYIWLAQGEFNPNARFECNVKYLDSLADYKRLGFHRIKIEEVIDYILTTYKVGSIIRHKGDEYTILTNDWNCSEYINAGYYDESPDFKGFEESKFDGNFIIPGYQVEGTYFAPIIGFTDDIESKPTNVVTSFVVEPIISPDNNIPSKLVSFMIDDPIEIDSSSYTNAYGVNGKAPFARCMDECGLPKKGAIKLLNTLTFGTSGMSNAQFNQSNFNKLSFQTDDELE